VNTDSADIIATLVLLKKEVETLTGNRMSLTVAGGLEAHLIAKELGEANVGVVQISARPFPTIWERRRMYVHNPSTRIRANCPSAYPATLSLRKALSRCY
jgi:hypothetical protein